MRRETPSADLALVGARLTATRDASRKTPLPRLSAAGGGGEMKQGGKLEPREPCGGKGEGKN